LVKYHNKGNKFLTHIVTGYETLMWHQRISSSQCNGGIVHLQR
jgi:hypothetical protein